MKSIKIYLLPLLLMFVFSVSANAQSDSDNRDDGRIGTFSVSDSLVVASYLTEIDYNEKHGVVKDCIVKNNKELSTDEIYDKSPTDNRRTRGSGWDAHTVEFVIDIAVHTAFIIAAFWH